MHTVAGDALNDDGAIELSSSRTTKTIKTPFRYSRSDSISSAEAVSSVGIEGQRLTFTSINEGIAGDMEFRRHSLAPSGYGDELGVDANTEIVLLQEPPEGVIGIRIDLEDIDPVRPLLITSGEMSGGTFLIGIDEEYGSVYVYRFGNSDSNPADTDADNVAIRHLLQTHNSLATRSDMRVAIPETVQKNDLIWFSKKFTKAIITYAEYPGTSGFTLLDPDFDLPMQPVAPSTIHSASSSSAELLNYSGIPGEKDIIQRTGNAYYVFSRKDDDHVTITGNAQYRGTLDTSAPKPGGESPAREISSSTVLQSDIRDIRKLLIDSDQKVSGLIRDPSTDTVTAVSSLGDYFLSHGYNVKYRIFDIWPSQKSSEMTRHYALVVEKESRSYVVDALARREFSLKGISDLIYTTDPLWRKRYAQTFPDRVILVRDVDTFEPLWNLQHREPPVRHLPRELSDPGWTVVNKLYWTLIKASEITESVKTNLEIDIGASRMRQGRLNSIRGRKTLTLSRERFEKWNKIISAPKFFNALRGSPPSALEKLSRLLTEENVNPEIIITKTYKKFYDKDPVTNYAIQVKFPDEPTDVIALKRSALDDSFEIPRVLPLNSWQLESRQQLTFFRLIVDPKTIPDYLDADTAAKDIGQSQFFNEMTSRYSLLHFDLAEMESLEETLARTRVEIDKYSGPYLGNDLKTERSILKKLTKNDDIRLQNIRVDQTVRYQFLRDLRGRLEDLLEKVRGEYEDRIILENRTGKRMLVKSKKFEERALKINSIRVKKYDSSSEKYLPDTGFLVMKSPDITLRFGSFDMKSIVLENLELYKEIYQTALSYGLEGQANKAKKIEQNAQSGIEMMERILIYSEGDYADNIYALIDSANFNSENPVVYGLYLVLQQHEEDAILHLDTWVAHPFTHFEDQQDFVAYSLRHGASWTLQQWEKYRTEDVDRFLIFNTARKSLAESSPKYLSMQIRTPRAENIASAFGFKEVNDLEFYGLEESLESTRKACLELLRNIFQSPASRRKPLPDPKGPREETPGVVSISALHEQWRCEGVSLAQATLCDEPGRFEGISSLQLAGTSTSPIKFKHYIKEGANTFEVRWDDSDHTWRVVKPLDPGTFGDAPRVRLENKHWVTYTDIPKSGDVPVSGRDAATYLIDLSEQQSWEIRGLVYSGHKRAIAMVEDALFILKYDVDIVNHGLGIFFGRYHDSTKDLYKNILDSISKFLNKINPIVDIYYKAGYFNDRTLIAVTRAGSALDDRTHPNSITISVDKLAEVASEKKFTDTEFKNYVANVLTHEAYHAVATAARDHKYVTIKNEIIDISNLASLPGLDLYGGKPKDIADKRGISTLELGHLRNQALADAFNNADNLAYLTALLSQIYHRSDLYQKFYLEFETWKVSRNSPLELKIRGYNKGNPIELITRTAIASLINGDIEPLRRNGLLSRTSSGHIPMEFDAIITGSSNTEVFDFQDPKFAGYLDTWLGSSTTSQKNGVWSGTWGSEHFLNEKFSIVEIRGEKSAVSAIRINLNKVRENHPLIISSGELSGSTIAFAVSGKGSDQYLYVFHAGHKSGDEVWKVSEQGVTDIYNAHRAMDGRPLKDLGVSDDGTPVEENGTPLSYRTLQQILGNYERGFVAYSGEMPNAPAADITASTAVEWVDYAQGDIVPTSGNGHAYALLTKQGETVDVKFYAGKSPAMKIGRDGKPKIKY